METQRFFLRDRVIFVFLLFSLSVNKKYNWYIKKMHHHRKEAELFAWRKTKWKNGEPGKTNNMSTSTKSPPNYLMTDELLRKPRKKRCGRQMPLAPFPVPIQTVTRQESGNELWYYYFGLLKSDHVAVYRKGDLTYLYQMVNIFCY